LLIVTYIFILDHNPESSNRRNRQCLRGCERSEDLLEVNAGRARNNTGLFSFPSMPLSRSTSKALTSLPTAACFWNMMKVLLMALLGSKLPLQEGEGQYDLIPPRSHGRIKIDAVVRGVGL
jgi:hypothetical protein